MEAFWTARKMTFRADSGSGNAPRFFVTFLMLKFIDSMALVVYMILRIGAGQPKTGASVARFCCHLRPIDGNRASQLVRNAWGMARPASSLSAL
jgi:hypothetical protein